MDRRRALTKIGLSALSVSLLTGCEKNEGQRPGGNQSTGQLEDDGSVDLLFVMEAKGVRFEDTKMTLIDLDQRTLFFADRPDEIAGYLPFPQFMELVTEGPDSFTEDPPNATLVVMGSEDLVNVVMRLSEKPRLEGGNLVFPAVEIIEGKPPSAGGTVAMFIDTVGKPLSPGSVAGVHRRHRRRATHHK